MLSFLKPGQKSGTSWTARLKDGLARTRKVLNTDITELFSGGPIDEAFFEELESTLLPALERHHLRLLAHSLRCLQQAAGDGTPLPDAAGLTAWAERQPNLAVDPTFIPVLVEQLGKAAVQLQQIAQEQGRAEEHTSELQSH